MTNRKALAGLALAAVLALTGCLAVKQNNAGNVDGSSGTTQEQSVSESLLPLPAETQESEKDADPLEKKIDGMTLDNKIGQMLIVGFEGYEADDRVKKLLESWHAGGVILFGRNIKSSGQLLSLVNSLKKANRKNMEPLFISVDEEGGRISRMPSELRKLPGNRTIGEINDGSFAYEIGSILAEEIKSFGFNMNFAPVLDVDSNPQNPVIGDRSFGADAHLVGRLGVQTMAGMRDGGVIPVVKHFPGHGDTSVDSHVGLPVVNYDMNRLNKLELAPFKAAIGSGADAVMAAHILMKKIDPEYPASMSKAVITDILRGQLGFEGVVITDDMTMGAVTKNYDIGEAAVRSVNAGCDILLVCHGENNILRVMEALKKAVGEGVITEDRINESVYRILALKSKYGLSDHSVSTADIDKINEKIDKLRYYKE
jgi:beta-N-acetylhexosaminidase